MDAPAQWLRVALALSLGPAISNGFARFCYALVLPSMQVSLNWSYTEAGALHGANALGYLLGAVGAPACMRRFGAKRVFRDTMFVTTASLLVMALATRYDVFLGLRFVGGVSSALTFIAGGVLAATLTDDPRRSSAALAIYFSGIGFAMFLSGLVLPAFFASAGDGAWAYAWLGLGLAALVAAFTAAWGASKVAPNPGSAVGAHAAVPWRRLVPIVLCYFAFGLGHVGYMTFIVAWLRANGSAPLAMSLVWGALSVMTILAPLWWRGPLQRWSGATVLAVATILSGLGAALALGGSHFSMLVASALLFGSSFLITPAAVTAFGKATLPPAAWGPLVAGFTVVFAIGQVVGPLLTGWLADVFGGLGTGLAASAAILMLGGAIGFAQRSLSPRP